MIKEIGKIESVRFGAGGYQDAMIGVSFQFSGKGWGSGDFWGYWSMPRSESSQWSEQNREIAFGKMVVRLSKLMEEAKVQDVSHLKDIPVEVTFESPIGKIVSWRILTEVL